MVVAFNEDLNDVSAIAPPAHGSIRRITLLAAAEPYASYHIKSPRYQSSSCTKKEIYRQARPAERVGRPPRSNSAGGRPAILFNNPRAWEPIAQGLMCFPEI